MTKSETFGKYIGAETNVGAILTAENLLYFVNDKEIKLKLKSIYNITPDHLELLSVNNKEWLIECLKGDVHGLGFKEAVKIVDTLRKLGYAVGIKSEYYELLY